MTDYKKLIDALLTIQNECENMMIANIAHFLRIYLLPIIHCLTNVELRLNCLTIGKSRPLALSGY